MTPNAERAFKKRDQGNEYVAKKNRTSTGKDNFKSYYSEPDPLSGSAMFKE